VLAAATAHSQTLVTAEWLSQRGSGPRLIILDTRPEADYRAGHIPGAALVNAWDNLVDSTPAGMRAFHQSIAEIFGRAGVGSKDRVVIYENKLGARAGRAYWMLRYAGHSKVHMLEGGLEAWKRKQLSVSADSPAPRPATRFRVRPQKKWVATASEVLALRKDPRVVILDVRTRAEYEGKSGSANSPRQGRIPGAVWFEWTQFVSPDGASWESAEKVRALLERQGITPDKQVVTYCHRGARAAMAWAALENLGFRVTKTYIGSWGDWAANKELPVEQDYP
jgi:thiosulfate/3-mercaptopyruvate sulfurtransferase